MKIQTKKLGLAAYIKMSGEKLVAADPETRLFTFESDKTANQWEVEYLNSCCHEHDSVLIQLRGLLQQT